MKNGVELLLAELLAPIECSQILRDKIAAVSTEILEITGAKIIDYGQARVRKFFVNTAESLERRLSDGRIGPRTACRLIDEACQRVRRHCAKYLEYADTRNFLFAAEHVKRDYGWRPPRQPRKPVIDTQQ